MSENDTLCLMQIKNGVVAGMHNEEKGTRSRPHFLYYYIRYLTKRTEVYPAYHSSSTDSRFLMKELKELK